MVAGEVELFIYIVGNRHDAYVVREYSQGRSIEKTRPSGTICEMVFMETIGDMKQWDELNSSICKMGKNAGIENLHDLYPSSEMKAILKVAGERRSRTQPTEES
jgi:hypothetical protein